MPSDKLGKARRIDDADGRYIEFCKSTFPTELDLRGMRIVLDCGHGATYHIAPSVFHELGAEVIAIGVKPDGLNINLDCGSTHPESLQRAVRENQADLGIAFDGDGDRVMMVDADGTLYDGDLMLYVIAHFRAKQGLLKGGVVGTVMSNLGLEHAFDKNKIPFARAAVGDRYVLEVLEEKGWQLGGESSGHIICRDKHSTGDGIISALQVLHALRAGKRTLKEAAKDVIVYPQVLINVPINKGFDFRDSIPVQALLVEADTTLKGNGRVLLRNSGTEPVLRVMVEGKDSGTVQQWAKKIAACVEASTQVA
jgi:phosphoglucosamine mutase